MAENIPKTILTQIFENKYNEILRKIIKNMVFFIIIPLTIVAIAGITGYLLYRFLINDFLCNRTVNTTLKEFKINKTQFEIIKEYHAFKGENISEKEIRQLQKHYRQHEPDQFLSMYDSIRDKSSTEKEN